MAQQTYDAAYYQRLEADIVSLLAAVSEVGEIELAQIHDFLDVGEYGLPLPLFVRCSGAGAWS